MIQPARKELVTRLKALEEMFLELKMSALHHGQVNNAEVIRALMKADNKSDGLDYSNNFGDIE